MSSIILYVGLYLHWGLFKIIVDLFECQVVKTVKSININPSRAEYKVHHRFMFYNIRMFTTVTNGYLTCALHMTGYRLDESLKSE